MLKTAILISGRGSNMEALIKAAKEPNYPARIALVISNELEAPGLAKARENNIPVEVINHRSYATPEAFERQLDLKLTEWGVQLVCLAGFMRILTSWFVEKWRDKIVNIHPSLLPAYPGLHTHKRALKDGAQKAGCTVHFVNAEMDAGPIIKQSVVPVLPTDTEDTLQARVLEAEHQLYPECLRLIAEGRVNVIGNTVFITDSAIGF